MSRYNKKRLKAPAGDIAGCFEMKEAAKWTASERFREV